jgi:hypothetical protein
VKLASSFILMMLLRCASAVRRRLVPQLSRVFAAADAQLQQLRFAHEEKQSRPSHRGKQLQHTEHKGNDANRPQSANSWKSEQLALREQVEAAGKRRDLQKVLSLIAERVMKVQP